jgi:hypothetical protein
MKIIPRQPLSRMKSRDASTLPALNLMAACVVPYGRVVPFVVTAPTRRPGWFRDNLSLNASKLQ